ncbi:MAG TPA: bifunctional hydroxymethylpyrimidine kinase/phosphomethylpyrimidine kinase [Actinomycetota bacterium]|nr:bifunctional hydroxymethylpyrimidine kinase/phosphomethylpyrimidine kinase [Actinomycetota bacterium]
MGAPATPVTGLRTALTIAGSDSGGGAGVQADLKVFFALGCHGTSAITALTAQNTVAVNGVHEVPTEFVVAQIEAVVDDLGVDAAKTGMLASAPIIDAVAKAVEAHGLEALVVDPVMVSKSGDRLLAEDAIEALRDRLLPLARVMTPNLHEASLLVGESIRSLDDMRAAARSLHGRGTRAVLVKGGHLEGDEAVDVFFDGEELVELRSERFDTGDTHGTGCALAAAITARLALGDATLPAVRFAKDFVAGAIRNSVRIGRGHGPVNPGWRLPLERAARPG